MAKVVLVSHDVQTVKGGLAGGVGAFVTQFAGLLRQAGEDVTILLTRQETFAVSVDDAWRRRYEGLGIRLIELHNTERDAADWCEPWTVRLAAKVTPLLAEFDIAYFQDWANVAFHAARLKRYGGAKLPVLVTVLHGPSGWIRVGEQRYPEIADELHLDYIERYAARHSDRVIAPSRYILEWAQSNGWQFENTPAVLGLPYMVKPAALPMGGPTKPVRIVFFGRLETRKGLALFVAALLLLPKDSLRDVAEIVLLGEEKDASASATAETSLAGLGVPVRHVGGLDSVGAGDYLAQHRGDSIVVIPSRAENFPYAVIEASSIAGLNLLCSNGGGTPEIFAGSRDEDLFEPYPLGLAQKLIERLATSASGEKPCYDAASANARWLTFHREALEPRSRSTQLPVEPRIDVCIPHYNHSGALRVLLQTLERESFENFSVIVVDDGSRAEERAAFDHLAEEYRDKGWTFVSQPNAFVDAARNRAASLSSAGYLLFIDADDLPAPGTLTKMFDAIVYSGDDCLVAGGLLFEGEGMPVETAARYMPLGPDLLLGLVDPMVLGTSMILIRRAAFEAVGGYRQVRGAAHEDWELQIRLLLAGFKADVFPEYLLYFRKSEGGLSNTSAEYAAKLRLIESYDDALGKVGLRGLAATCVSLLQRRNELEAAVRESEDSRAQRLHGLVGEMLRRKGIST